MIHERKCKVKNYFSEISKIFAKNILTISEVADILKPELPELRKKLKGVSICRTYLLKCVGTGSETRI